MPKVSSKRQITLPIDLCHAAGIGPGDEYDSYIDNCGRITVVKKELGSALGVLNHIVADKSISDEASMQDGMCR